MLNYFAEWCFRSQGETRGNMNCIQLSATVRHSDRSFRVASPVHHLCTHCETLQNSTTDFAPGVACRATFGKLAKPCSSGRQADCGTAETSCAQPSAALESCAQRSPSGREFWLSSPEAGC